jgi:hypothetical protein
MGEIVNGEGNGDMILAHRLNGTKGAISGATVGSARPG